MEKNILATQRLYKRYQSRIVNNNVTLEVKNGEVVGLLGPNGAGKTTCFYMIVGLTQPEKGRIMLNDDDITSMPMHKRARIGLSYLPQEPSIFRKLTVEENIMAILQAQPQLNKAERKQKLETLLNDLGIENRRKNLGISLSGGERRRVEIARALACNPRFILLDEPFAGVDPISVIEIQQLIIHLQNKNIGVLITDHNVRETLKICNRAFILNEGAILTSGSPDEIMSDKDVKKVYLGENFRL